MARLNLPCIGSAGGRLPVRTGDLYTGQHRQRPGRRRPPRHSHQRWRLSGRRPQAALAGSGQDRHDHARQARTDRLCHMGQCTRLGQPQHRCQSGGPLGPSCIQGGGTGRADGRGCLARRGRIQRAARSGCARPNQRCDLPSGQPPDARSASLRWKPLARPS